MSTYGKKTSKDKTTTCRRDSLSARRVNRFCFSKHGAGSTKRSFSSLLFPYGWHFPPVSFEEFLTPGVFLCCQFVAGLVRMRIFPASIIPESSDTRCFYPLKKQKSKTQSFPQNFLQFWSSWLRIEKIHRRQLNTSDTLNCMYRLFCWCTVCFIEKLSLRVNL